MDGLWLLICFLFLFTFHYVSILILSWSARPFVPSSFTFHYVSILIFLCHRGSCDLVAFTFHYVSILIKAWSCWSVQPCIIYIPLCLYFNKDVQSHGIVSRHIYIPLCLYFNCVIIWYQPGDKYIYIPLCLYFNWHGSQWDCHKGNYLHSIMSLF